MAFIKLGNTKSASNTLSYCEKKAEIKDGLNCSPEYAKNQFQATRQIFGKNTGIQAHTIIQSFKPGETTPTQANEIGLKLAEKIAKGYEVVVFTHADKDHIHNHIVINSVNFENGNKYHSSMKDLYNIKEQSNELCKEYGLSVINENNAKIRYTLAEKSLIEKGQSSWKDEIRAVIDAGKIQSNNYNEFKSNLKETYGVEVNDKGKHITFKHPDNDKVVRGKTLGANYEKGAIEHGIVRQVERQSICNRKITSVEQRTQNRVREQPVERSISDIERKVRRVDEKVKLLTSSGRAEQTERQRREQEIIKRAEQQRVELEKAQRNIKRPTRQNNFEHER